MKIVHIITRLILGGAQENTLITCKLLAQRGHDVTLVTGPALGPEGDLYEFAQNQKFNFLILDDLRRQINPHYDIPAYFQIKDILRELKPQIVHTHSAKAGILGRYAAHSLKGKWGAGLPKVVHSVHGLAFHSYQCAILNKLYIAVEKAAAKRVTEIAIIFKKVPHLMFASAGIDELPANTLVLKIQPKEGISLFFEAKRPGPKLCIGTLQMDFNYAEIFGTDTPDAYERLLLDCMLGDQTLFTRIDDVKIAWGLIDNVLNTWKQQDLEPFIYPAGSESFPEADAFIQKDGRNWRKISEM